MSPAPIDTTALLRAYHDEHQRAVERILASLRRPYLADRPDVAQEVFLAAHHELALQRFRCRGAGFLGWRAGLSDGRATTAAARPASPRLAWMRSRRRSLSTPWRASEQQFGNCQLLALLLDEVDEQARGIVLAHLADGRTWEEIAEEQNPSIDRAKYPSRQGPLGHGGRARATEVRRGSRRVALLPPLGRDLRRGARGSGRGAHTGRAAAAMDGAGAKARRDRPPARPIALLLGPALTFLVGGAAGFALGLAVQDRPLDVFVGLTCRRQRRARAPSSPPRRVAAGRLVVRDGDRSPPRRVPRRGGRAARPTPKPISG